MTNRRVLAIALSLVIAVGACSGSGPAPSGAAGSPGPGASVDPAFAVPAISVEALADRDERILAEALRGSGGETLLKPGLADWLDEQRREFVASVLEKGGVTASTGEVASTDPRAGLDRPLTAIGANWFAMMMTGLFVGLYGDRRRPPQARAPTSRFPNRRAARAWSTASADARDCRRRSTST